MRPTLGRIVIYRLGTADYPAIVTGVGEGEEEGRVHLTCFPSGVQPIPVMRVAQAPPQGDVPEGTWRWPERV